MADALSRIPSTENSTVHEAPDPPCLTVEETHPAGESKLSESDLQSEVGDAVPQVEDEEPKAGSDRRFPQPLEPLYTEEFLIEQFRPLLHEGTRVDRRWSTDRLPR